MTVRSIVLAALAASTVTPATAAPATGGAPCDYVAFSPQFGTDGTAMCGH